MLVAAVGLDHTKVIDLTIAVEIEVGECTIRVVQTKFKFLEVLGTSEEVSNRAQVELLRDVGRLCLNGDLFVCANHRCGAEHHRCQNRQKKISSLHNRLVISDE